MTLIPVVTAEPDPVLYECCIPSDDVVEPPVTPIVSDGIIKARPLYFNSYDTGTQQSLTRESLAISTPTDSSWIVERTGGRRNGGYAKSVKNPNPTGGQFSSITTFTAADNVGVAEDHPYQSGIHIAYNLFGQELIDPINILGLAGSSNPTHHIILQILPDLRVRAILNDLTTIVATSTLTVLANGWFVLDWQNAISKLGNDASGFSNLRLFTVDLPSYGASLLKSLNVKVRGSSSFDSVYGYYWGTEVIPTAGPGLDDIGVDDVVIYGAYGSINRFLGDTAIQIILPSSDDEVESSITFARDITYGEVGATPVDGIIAISNDHGNSSRFSNLAGTTTDLDSKLNDITFEEFVLGDISPFTSIWLTGPFVYGPDLVTRNTFNDEQADLYNHTVPPESALIIEGFSPFLLACKRSVLGGILGFGFKYELVGAHPTNTDFETVGAETSLLQVFANYDGEIIDGRYDIASFISDGWRAMRGYMKEPWSIIVEDSNSDPITLAKLASIKAGVKGSSTLNPARDWGQFDVGQYGIEIGFHLAELNITEHDPYPPIAKLIQYLGSVEATGHLVVRDASEDWDGDIVSRVVDWDDSTPTESITTTPRFNAAEFVIIPTLTHDYTESGTKSPKVTVTDAEGLIDVSTFAFVIPHLTPAANFDYTDDGLELTFEDLSVGNLATIVSWLWDFGDGNTSTLQNPVHTYAGAGTYTITLTVTDNHGLTHQAEIADLDLPIVVAPTDCPLSAITLANTLFAQGDDFAGGNPPLTSYLNRAAFDVFYQGGTFRNAYAFGFGSSSRPLEYDIDTSVLYDSHNTLRMQFGNNPLPPVGTRYTGAGWETDPKNDASPVEAGYTVAPFGPTAQWFRIIFKAELGVMSDVSVINTSTFDGLSILGMFGRNVDFAVCNRAGRIFVDVETRLVTDAIRTIVSYDVADENVFIGRSSGFGELIVRYEGDNTAHTADLRVWLGDACSLTGVSPTLNTVLTAAIGSAGASLTHQLAIDWMEWFNWNFLPTGPNKNLWVGLWETVPVSTSANPYGVALT